MTVETDLAEASATATKLSIFSLLMVLLLLGVIIGQYFLHQHKTKVSWFLVILILIQIDWLLYLILIND